jgi:aminoglycoside phosphotransferase (APT) family kinase protein
MAHRLKADERARQLPLLPEPGYPVERRLLHVDGPLPEALPIEEHDRRRAILLHATGDASPHGTAWAAVLRVQGVVVWKCLHLHRSAEGGRKCAWQARGIVLAHAHSVPTAEGASIGSRL